MHRPKDPYLLPDIDWLIDESSSYKTLTFIDTYSIYNQIKMDPLNTPKIYSSPTMEISTTMSCLSNKITQRPLVKC